MSRLLIRRRSPGSLLVIVVMFTVPTALPVGVGPQLVQMAQDPAGALDLDGDVELGDREPRLGPGAGEDVAAGADDLGLAEEAHAAHRAGLVGGGQYDLVLGGAGLVV